MKKTPIFQGRTWFPLSFSQSSYATSKEKPENLLSTQDNMLFGFCT